MTRTEKAIEIANSYLVEGKKGIELEKEVLRHIELSYNLEMAIISFKAVFYYMLYTAIGMLLGLIINA